MILFLGAVVLLLAMVAFGLFMMFSRMRKLGDKGGDQSNVGFVVDTFHTLMAQLKEKEKELRELRAKAEERAGIAEDYNENILQSVPSGVISLDHQWRVVKMNSSAERILQVKAFDLASTDARETLREFIGSANAEGRGQIVYRTRTGRRLWLDYSLTPLVDAHGKDIGRLLIFTDLTELKALEAQAELRERLSSLGEMAAGIAHELRNPMGVISGYMRLLSKKVDPSLTGTVKAVSREVSDMERIISDFLAFARPGEPSCSEMPLKPLVEDCIHSAIGERKDIQALISVPDGMVLWADDTLLRQVFTNLIQNAAEAQDRDGVIEVSAQSVNEAVVVTVADRGPGIDEAVRTRMFQPFFTTKDKGTGLGLAMVHRIVTVHGGSIDVVTPPEGGTRFILTFPLKG
jgi:PAS domain S-box-containing protein